MKVAAIALLASAALAVPLEQAQTGQVMYQAPPPGYYGYGPPPPPAYYGYGPPSILGGIVNAAGNLVGGVANTAGNVIGGLADGVDGILGDVVGIGKDLTDAIFGALPWTARTEAQLAEIRAAIAPINAKYAAMPKEQE